MSKHTGLPWESEDVGPGSEPMVRSRSGNGCLVAICNRTYTRDAQANADFIARACNSHDELLEALKYAVANGFTYSRRLTQNRAHCDAVDRARAAIAKAEGSS